MNKLNKKSTSTFIDENLSKLSNMEKIIETMRKMGGKATGMQILDQIVEQYKVPEKIHRSLMYRINAILCSNSLFVKEGYLYDKKKNSRCSLWKIKGDVEQSVTNQ